MYNMEKVYNVTDFAEMIGKSVKTLQRWDREGILRALRRLYEKRMNYARDKINKLVVSLVRAKPDYITMEDLSIRHMLEHTGTHKLHDLISQSLFGYFK